MLEQLLGRDFVFYDGAMGTMLQKRGLKRGQYPDLMNITAPDVVLDIQRMYAEAGSDIICTDTLNANARNLRGTGCTVSEVITASVQITKQAGNGKTLTALDLGPIGSVMEPMGTLTFDEAYRLFREEAEAAEAAGADLVAMETMSDLSELRAAILAVRDHTKLPIFATMTFNENGRTYTGCLPESFAVVAEGLGAAAIGINCSLAPGQIYPIAERIANFTTLPLIIKPNAGLPNSLTGEYDLKPEDFAKQMAPYAALGVKIVGGCCGTTPEYIRVLKETFSALKPGERTAKTREIICSATHIADVAAVHFDGRPDDAGKDLGEVVDNAYAQAENGASVIHVRLPSLGPRLISKAIREIQSSTHRPLHLISCDHAVLEAALRAFSGRAAVSCLHGENKEKVLAVIQKFGAYYTGANE